MSRTSVATPCPAPYALSNLPVPIGGRRLSRTSFGSAEDDTAEIDYTRAIQVEFKNARPMRKSTFHRRDKKDAGITIFEDVLEDQELVVESRPNLGGNTLLGRRAQKMPGRALPQKEHIEVNGQQPLRAIGQGRRTSIALQAAIPENEIESRTQSTSNAEAERLVREGLKREPRRRTIFVPPDDTTVLTIHPGANTTDRLNDTFQLPDYATSHRETREETRLAPDDNAPQPAKRPRMSLAAAPKRVPLQQVLAKHANVSAVDVAGQNGGKENMPPGARILNKVERGKPAVSIHHVEKGARSRSSVFEPTAASRARRSVAQRNAVPLSKYSSNGTKRRSTVTGNAGPAPHINPGQRSTLVRPKAKGPEGPASRPAFVGSNSKDDKPCQRPVERKVSRLQHYPVLSEDIAQPELYEDSWLGHQEVALTELVNQIFSRAEPGPQEWQKPEKSLRDRMLDIYHQEKVATLYKRIQASLLFGALSRPRDALSPPNPSLDLGLRKRFLGLWLDHYDQKALHVASEVIFGHELPQQPQGASGSGSSLDPHRGRRTLIGFLETFLVEVEDVEAPDTGRGDDANARWRKMVLRSLMLIWLLDQAKSSQAVEGCLFKSTSVRKSSVSMLHTLTSLLIPSIGDITRVLRHLDYEVSHVQDPLDEVRYRVDNIAVDLRDGILLTRLVELLLFTPKQSQVENLTSDATVTVQLHDLTVLESAMYDTEGVQCPRILSQHLKMPCLGRAQKLYNTEIAISALHTHGNLGDGAIDVTAEDVVDGHREKSLSLIWSLVSTYGLQELVDFETLVADIRRTAIHTNDEESLPRNCTALSQLQQESSLKRWASAYCARSGVRISNLTTSFADGNAYSAILTAFADYMETNARHQMYSPQAIPRDLEAQLHAFGCSAAFVKQLTSACCTIPSRKTTISNLAFLASRLLPVARRHNAALVIQRAFRLKCSRKLITKRLSLLRLAHSCATVVQTRNRLISAAIALQRSWRDVLDARIKRLNRDVEKFQAVARRWTTARRFRQVLGVGSNSHSLRAMGGW